MMSGGTPVGVVGVTTGGVVGRVVGVGSGFGLGFGAAPASTSGGGAPASCTTRSGFFPPFHVSVVWHVSHCVENVSWSGNVEVARSSSWQEMHSFFVSFQVAGSPRWHQKHFTCFSVPATSLSAAALACAPVSSHHG